MSAIGSVSQLVQAIRSELTGRVAPAAGKSRAPVRQAPDRYADANLAGLIALRVRQIGRDDPQRGRKAFRVFLEVVLLAHFGGQLLADPRFYQMLDDVQRAMEADQECATLIGEAIEQLLAQTP